MSPMNKSCPVCGAQWDGAVAFCGECGAPVGGEAPSAPGAPVKGARKARRSAPPPAARRDLAGPKPFGPETEKALLSAGFDVTGAPGAGAARSGETQAAGATAAFEARPAAASRSDLSIAALAPGSPGAMPRDDAWTQLSPDELPSWSMPPPPTAEAAPAPDPGKEAERAVRHESDMAAVRELFESLAAGYATPLRDFMIEARHGGAPKEWIEITTPAAAALRRAAQELELPELANALDAFIAALGHSERTTGPSLDDETRELLATAYASLVAIMPGVFALEHERGRREPIIVRSLLLQVPEVRKVALDKIYAAGLTTLEMFYGAKPRDIADTADLSLEIAARVCEKFQSYRSDIAALSPDKDRAREREKLDELWTRLESAHQGYERASAAWSSGAAAERAGYRKERERVLLEVNVLLARLGEVDRLRALEKKPFAEKLRDLRQFLDDAKRRAVRP